MLAAPVTFTSQVFKKSLFQNTLESASNPFSLLVCQPGGGGGARYWTTLHMHRWTFSNIGCFLTEVLVHLDDSLETGYS